MCVTEFNQLHVMIFQICFINLRYIPHILYFFLPKSLVEFQSGYFSNSTGSSLPTGRFSPFTARRIFEGLTKGHFTHKTESPSHYTSSTLTNNLFEASLTQNRETMALQTFITVDSFYFIMCENPHE